MTIAAPPPGLQPEDYEEIEAAVMETARGRWFLSEYARRLRAAEIDRLLAAVARLERRLDGADAPTPATTARLMERLNDFAWALRERGVDDYICAQIEAVARDIGGETALVASTATPLAPETATPEPVSGAAAAAARMAPPPIDPRLAALSELDALPLVDRMALFA